MYTVMTMPDMKKLDDVSRKIFLGVSSYTLSKFRNKTAAAIVPLLRAQNILENHINPEGCLCYDVKSLPNAERFIVYPGDVVLVIKGTKPRAAVVPKTISSALISDNLGCISVNTRVVDPFYLAGFLNTYVAADSIIKKFRIRAVSLFFLRIKQLKEIKVPVPPMKTQKRIAKKISIAQQHYKKYMETIRRERKQIENKFWRLVDHAR